VIPGSEEWLADRRKGVTSTDIPAILGISPWKSEADVALDKLGVAPDEPDAETARRWRLGHALEPVVRAEEIVEHGFDLRRVNRTIVSSRDPILRTSLDFERIGERTIVEVKTSTSRGDWRHGLPEYVEAQVQWQMGVARYPRAHVAALLDGRTLQCYDVDADPVTFAGLVAIAHDFWRRLPDGPFSESKASVRRRYPLDDGTEIDADPETVEAVQRLVETKHDIALLSDLRERLETAIQTRMGPATVLRAPGYRVTWRATKDRREADYKGLATEALGIIADPIMIDGLTEKYTTTKPGVRRFVVSKEDTSDTDHIAD